MSGRTAVGQKKYWKILLIFQVRKGRVKAATAKPADEMRAVTSHRDVSPRYDRNSKTSQRHCRDQALLAGSLSPLWLLLHPPRGDPPQQSPVPVLPLPRDTQHLCKQDRRSGVSRAGGRRAAGSHPVPSHTAWG